LEEKRMALVAESDVYRQTLLLEVQNLRLHALRTKRRFSRLTRPNPLLMLVLPIAKSFIVNRLFRRRRRQKGLMKLAAGALFGWNVYRKVKPFLGGIFSRYQRGSDSAGRSAEEHVPPANP